MFFIYPAGSDRCKCPAAWKVSGTPTSSGRVGVTTTTPATPAARAGRLSAATLAPHPFTFR